MAGNVLAHAQPFLTLLQHGIFQQQIVPVLPAVALVSLTCASKQLYASLTGMDLGIWRGKAKAALPAGHPVWKGCLDETFVNVAALLLAINRYSLACKNIPAGQHRKGASQ